MMQHELPLLRGWQAQRLEDGTWRVLPPRRSRFWGMTALFIAGLLQVFFWCLLPPMLSLIWKSPIKFWFAMLLLQGPSFLIICWSLMWIYSREEWLVGHNRLQVWTLLFGYKWKRRRKTGALVAARTLGQGSRCYGLYTVSGSRAEMPAFNPRLMEGCSREDVRKAGAFLSDVTGWPLHEWTG